MHYVIGDVHGCVDALDTLVAEIAPDSTDTLLFVGDYLDMGPDGWGVYRRLRTLEEALGATVVLLRGCREQYFLNSLAQAQAGMEMTDLPYLYGTEEVQWRRIWAELGGAETAEVLQTRTAEELLELSNFLAQLPYLWTGDVEGKRTLVCHAGIDPEAETLSRQPKDALLWAKGWEEYLVLRHEQENDCPWDVIVTGHRPIPRRDMLFNREDPTIVNVDTGAGLGGYLTSYCIETGSRISVSTKTGDVIR